LLLGKRHTITADIQFEQLVRPLFEDSIRTIDLDQIIIPRTAARFKLADILAIEKLISMREIDTILTVNAELMLTDGLKRYYAMRRLRIKKVRVRIDKDMVGEGDECPFSIIR